MTTYHKCHFCRCRACESVVATTLKTPDGKPWAMYACSTHDKDLHKKSDELLGVGNGVMRIYTSTTGGFDKSESEEYHILRFHADVQMLDEMKAAIT